MKTSVLCVVILLFSAITFGAEYTESETYQVEVAESGSLQVRKATRVFRDGVEIAKTYHRHVLAPGDDTENEVQKVKDIAKAAWTVEVVEAEAARKAANGMNVP